MATIFSSIHFHLHHSKDTHTRQVAPRTSQLRLYMIDKILQSNSLKGDSKNSSGFLGQRIIPLVNQFVEMARSYYTVVS